MTTARFALWTLAWLVTLAVAKVGPELLWDSQQVAASWAAVVVNLVVGIGWIVAFARYLQAQDELQRKILQDALTITLGVGWVGGFAYVVADAAGLIANAVQRRPLPGAPRRRLPDRRRRRHVPVPMKNRITTLRAERGWTQADLAMRAGVSRQTINAIEKGKFDPSLPVAFRLARLFDLKIEESSSTTASAPRGSGGTRRSMASASVPRSRRGDAAVGVCAQGQSQVGEALPERGEAELARTAARPDWQRLVADRSMSLDGFIAGPATRWTGSSTSWRRTSSRRSRRPPAPCSSAGARTSVGTGWTPPRSAGSASSGEAYPVSGPMSSWPTSRRSRRTRRSRSSAATSRKRLPRPAVAGDRHDLSTRRC